MKQIEINKVFLLSIRGLCSFLAFAFGFTSLTLGLHSYIHSDWNELHKSIKKALNGSTTIIVGINEHETRTLHLPDLAKEQIFLAISVFTFSASLIFFVLNLFGQEKSKKLVHTFGNISVWSLGFHLIGSVALFCSGTLLLLSASDIKRFAYILNQNPFMNVPIKLPDTNVQLYSEKIVAGIISILNGLVFAFIAAFDRNMLPKYTPKPKPKAVPIIKITINKDDAEDALRY